MSKGFFQADTVTGEIPEVVMNYIRAQIGGGGGNELPFAGQVLQTRGASWIEFGSYGAEPFPSLLRASLGFDSIQNAGRAGRRAQQNAALMLANGAYQMNPAFAGPVLIHEPGNNLIEDDTAANRAAALNGVRAIVAAARASKIVKNTEFTFANNQANEPWNERDAQPFSTEGTMRIGVFGGLKMTVAVEAGTAYLLCHGTDASIAPGMSIRVTQNGNQVALASTHGTTLKVPNYDPANGDAEKNNSGVSPFVIRLPNLAAGTITVETVRDRENSLAFVDSLLPQKARKIILVKPVTLASASHNKPDLLAFLRTIPDTVAAEFGGDIVVVDPEPGWNPSTMLGADGLHPNQAGVEHTAAAVTNKLK